MTFEEKVYQVLKNVGQACNCVGQNKLCPDQLNAAQKAYAIGEAKNDVVVPGFIDFPTAIGWWLSGQPLYSLSAELTKTSPLFMCIKATPFVLTPDKVVKVDLNKYLGF
jgi:hypothetical protein